MLLLGSKASVAAHIFAPFRKARLRQGFAKGSPSQPCMAMLAFFFYDAGTLCAKDLDAIFEAFGVPARIRPRKQWKHDEA